VVIDELSGRENEADETYQWQGAEKDMTADDELNEIKVQDYPEIVLEEQNKPQTDTSVYTPYAYPSAPTLSKAETAPPQDSNPFYEEPK